MKSSTVFGSWVDANGSYWKGLSARDSHYVEDIEVTPQSGIYTPKTTPIRQSLLQLPTNALALIVSMNEGADSIPELLLLPRWSRTRAPQVLLQ